MTGPRRAFTIGMKTEIPCAENLWYPGSALHRLNGRDCACQRCMIGGIVYQPPPPTRDKRRPKKGDTRHGRR